MTTRFQIKNNLNSARNIHFAGRSELQSLALFLLSPFSPDHASSHLLKPSSHLHKNKTRTPASSHEHNQRRNPKFFGGIRAPIHRTNGTTYTNDTPYTGRTVQHVPRTPDERYTGRTVHRTNASIHIVLPTTHMLIHSAGNS